jgi:hypothetical protein
MDIARGASLATATIASAGTIGVLLVTSAQTADVSIWAWILTGLQVAAMWSAGRGWSAGWLLGAAVQPVWIAYAFVTGQEGFVIGCLVSGFVQLSNYMRPAFTTRAAQEATP